MQAWLEKFPDDRVEAIVRTRDRDEVAREWRADRWLSNARIHVTRAPVHALAAMSANSDADVVLTQNFSSIVPGRAKRVTFLHDLIFLEHPEWFTWAERRYLAAVRPSLARADLILTTSESEAARIRRHVRGRAVTAVGLGMRVDLEVADAHRPATAPSSDFLLAVGRINRRKNLGSLIRALADGQILGDNLSLVVVGSPDGARDELDPELRAHVHFMGDLSDSGLRWLYENTRLFVFPSLDEGFGMPIIEAARFGSQMAVSDIPPFRELNATSFVFDPLNRESMVRAVRAALDAPKPQRRVPQGWGEVVSNMRESILEHS
ncbi:glycosyltransferase family 4 protein [Microbacterium sp. NPDC091313]